VPAHTGHRNVECGRRSSVTLSRERHVATHQAARLAPTPVR
jgi:hypothetical protein